MKPSIRATTKTITVIFHELKKLVGGEPKESEKPEGRIGYRTSKDMPSKG